MITGTRLYGVCLYLTRRIYDESDRVPKKAVKSKNYGLLLQNVPLLKISYQIIYFHP